MTPQATILASVSADLLRQSSKPRNVELNEANNLPRL
jgi:hypothetical protein